MENKFKFKPKQWVLVRDNKNQKWGLARYSHYDANYKQPNRMLSHIGFEYCIPYKGNKHLLGTKDDYVEQYKPNDGDFVIFKTLPIYGGTVGIFKEFSRECDYEGFPIIYAYVNLDGCNLQYSVECVKWPIKRLATEEEKQLLLSKLHEIGKKWDESKKEIVEYRWKPKEGEIYYFVSGLYDAKHVTWSEDSSFDEAQYEIGNCFRTEAEAQAMADKFKELLKGENHA